MNLRGKQKTQQLSFTLGAFAELNIVSLDFSQLHRVQRTRVQGPPGKELNRRH